MPSIPTVARVQSPALARWTTASTLLLVILWALENLIGERTGWTALPCYLPQHGWAFLPFILGVTAFWKRRWSLLAVNGVAVLFWGNALMGFHVPLPMRHENSGIRIVSYNVERGKEGIFPEVDTLHFENPDIICLQESQRSSSDESQMPGAKILTRFPGWNFARAGDVMTLSRYRLVSEQVYPQRGTRRLLVTTWSTPKGLLRVLNVHVSTNFKGESYARSGLLNRARQILANSGGAARARMEQLPAIFAAGRNEEKTPLVVAGDFNTPSRGLFYRALTRKWSDAWTECGWGSGASYPARFLLLSIDHVFLGNGAWAVRAYRPKSYASDHLPLVVDAIWGQ